MDLVDFLILRAFSHQRSGLGQDFAELCFCLCFRCMINCQAAVHSDFMGIIPIFFPEKWHHSDFSSLNPNFKNQVWGFCGFFRICGFFFSASNLPHFCGFFAVSSFPHTNQREREKCGKNAYKITLTDSQREMRKIAHKKYP